MQAFWPVSDVPKGCWEGLGVLKRYALLLYWFLSRNVLYDPNLLFLVVFEDLKLV